MKNKRQDMICRIIEKCKIGTQCELAAALQDNGVLVTQATVSRDIRELALIKTPDKDCGGYRYVLPSKNQMAMVDGRLERTLKDSITEVGHNEMLAVIHTVPGAANYVAYTLDNIKWDEVLGTIAGDDTVFVALKDGADVVAFVQRLKEFI